MTIKQQGGIFGRNPSFNEVTVDTLSSPAVDLQSNGVADFKKYISITDTNVRINMIETDTTDENTQIRNQSGNFQIRTLDDDLASGTTRFEIDHANGNTTVSTGNLVIGTSGQGIDFSATSGTGTSELLDDYEEGTWTPTLIGATSGSMSFAVTSMNRYTKVGRVVHAVAFLSSGDMGAHTISGNVLVSGLPFTATSVGAGVVSVTYCNLTTADEADITLSGYANGTNIHLLKGSSITALTNADLVASGTNGAIMLDITYETEA